MDIQLLRRYHVHLIMLTSITIQTILWLKGGIWYGGDQNFIIYPGSSDQMYINAIIYGISNYPFLAGPVVATPFFWFWGLVALFNKIPFVYSQYLLVIFLFFIGSVYVYKLIFEIILTKATEYEKIFISLVLSIVYMSNWGLYFADSQSSGITFLTIPFIYNLLAPTVYYMIKTFYEKDYINKLRYYGVLIILFMILGSTSNIYNFGEVFGLVLIISLGYLVIYRKKSNILNFISIIFIFFVSNLYWILPTIPSVNLTLSDPNFLRVSYEFFVGNARPFEYVFFGFYNYSSSWFINLLASMIIVSIPFLFINKNKHLLFWGIMYFVISTLYSGVGSPFGSIYEYLFLHVPYFVEFRTLVVAFGWLQGFVLSIIVPVGFFYAYKLLISSIGNKVPKVSGRVLISLALLVVVIISVLPVITGQNYASIHIPEYFINTVSYVNSQEGCFNVLALPKTNLWAKTNWYYGNNLLIWFLDKPVFVGGDYDYPNPQLKNLYELLDNSLRRFDSSNILLVYNILYLLNIKYIILQGDMQGYNITQYLVSLNQYEKHGLLTLVKNYSPYYIYRVNINSSMILGSNSSIVVKFDSSLLYKYNLSTILHPIPFDKVNPSVYVVDNKDQYKYIVFLYSYNDLWRTIPPTTHERFCYANLFITTDKSIKIINHTYELQIMQYTYMGITILISLVLIFSKNILGLYKYIRRNK